MDLILLILIIFYLGAGACLFWWLAGEDRTKGVRKWLATRKVLRRFPRKRVQVIPPDQIRRLRRKRLWFNIDRELYRH